MAQVVYSAHALDQIERAFRFLRDENPEGALKAVVAIQSAVDSLSGHPFIGRRIQGELRELIISFGQTGFVALYRFVASADQVRVLAIRHQRELGYQP